MPEKRAGVTPHDSTGTSVPSLSGETKNLLLCSVCVFVGCKKNATKLSSSAAQTFNLIGGTRLNYFQIFKSTDNQSDIKLLNNRMKWIPVNPQQVYSNDRTRPSIRSITSKTFRTTRQCKSTRKASMKTNGDITR
jgi:hypothetical protein